MNESKIRSESKIREAIPLLWNNAVGYKGFHSPCILSSLMHVHRRPGLEVAEDLDAIEEVVREQFPERSPRPHKRWNGNVYAFNDNPITTRDEAVMVMEKAAVRREETR